MLIGLILNPGRWEMGKLADGQATAGEPTGFLNIDILITQSLDFKTI